MTVYAVFIKQATNDPAGLARYTELAAPSVAQSEGTPLAFYGEHQVLEGAPIEGAVVLSFPDMAAAHTWYDGQAYQAVLPLRKAAATFSAFLVEGVS